MRKYYYLLLTVFLFISCTEDVKFNTPAFQGLKDNVFWRAKAYSAYTKNGSFVIRGLLETDGVNLRVPYPVPGTYILGIDDTTTASYSNVFLDETPQFTTGTNKGSGQIVITEYNAQNQTISGTFKFYAVNVDEKNIEKPGMSFTEGVFYKIPITPNLYN
ncbi:DUF6252 family protein [Flavobacterium chilense]|uniref:Uncharacterized protein n=1 Tax=Flavobacterium chilense TaxID=946677 RepID=A0A1M7KZJ1_9FLAO|nr:DUF6252 family protein [Flavobacterium chilense]SHM71115.1 hypothetical protein SAMN05444484_108204 [Flavobacterium chilense]